MHICVHVCKHANTHTLTVTLYTPAIVNHSRFPGTLPLYFHKWIFFFYVKAQFIQLPCSATTIVILTQVLSLTPTPWKFSLTCLPQELLRFLPLCSGIQTQLAENRLYQWIVSDSVHCIQYDHQFPNISFLLDRKLSKNWTLC